MADTHYAACEVCEAPDRYEIEQAYLMGERRTFRYSRAKLEAHAAHLAEPESLRLALGMSSAVAVAARLRMLESQVTQVLDAAMKEGSGSLALKAVREARETMKLMANLGAHLAERASNPIGRPDVDDAILEALRSRGVNAAQRTESDDDGPSSSPSAPLALPEST